MLIKFDADDSIADELKALTGNRVASKAFQTAGERYAGLVAQVKSLQRENSLLRDSINHQKNVMREAVCAAAALIDKASQEDMFI